MSTIKQLLRREQLALSNVLSPEYIPFFDVLPSIAYGGWRGHLTAAVAQAAQSQLSPIGDPGLLYGSDALYGKHRRLARVRAQELLRDSRLNNSVPLVLV